MTVIIATKDRPGKLLRCLESIPPHIAIRIHATAASGIPPTTRPLQISIGPENVVQACNLLAASTHGDVLTVPDDVQFAPDYFTQLATFAAAHPQAWVIGTRMSNIPRHAPDCVCFVRRAALQERGHLYHPRLRHFFSDTELGHWARARGVFAWCPQATLVHHHPQHGGEQDDTHRHQRLEKWRHDKAVWDEIKGSSRGRPAAIAQT